MFSGCFIFYFPNGHVGVKDRYIGYWGKREAEYLSRDEEHGVPDLVELEIRLDFVLIKIESRLANLLHVEAVIPRLDRDLCSRFVSKSLHIRHFFVDTSNR